MQPEAPWGESTHWLTCLTIDPAVAGVTREQVRLALEAENIEARPVWKPMHLQPVFASAEMHGGKVSARLFDQGLCLPSGAGLSEEDRGRVIDVVRRALA
jgi:pyridoxal phosphate-dependent aminotransferase EpsN